MQQYALAWDVMMAHPRDQSCTQAIHAYSNQFEAIEFVDGFVAK